MLAMTFIWASLPAEPGGSLYPEYNTDPMPPDPIGMESTAAEIAGRIALGWNLGNSLEATGGETAWGNPKVSRDLIDRVKASGFDAIRIPASWDQYADPDTAEIDPRWLIRVEQVVRYCLADDLYVILNVHWDGGWLEKHVTPESEDAVAAMQKAFWQQIATHFRDYDERLMFASANEPDVETARRMKVLLHYHQVFVDAVRSTGGRNAYRVLVVQGPRTDFETTDALWHEMPADTVSDRLMMELHFYTPYNFAGLAEDQDWGKQFYYWGKDFHSRTDPGRNATWGEEESVDKLFAKMKRKFVDRGIPVIIGEYGAMRRDNLTGDALALHLASRVHYLEYVTRQAVAHGMVPFYWDNGQEHLGSGIFDRKRSRVLDQRSLDALLKGAGK